MTIETNYKDFATKIVFSLKNIEIPSNETERAEFLNSLGVYINHTDGDQELNKGTIVYDEAGNPVGIEIEISKFSTFTIVSINNTAPVVSDLTITGVAEAGNELAATYTYSDADQDEQGDSLISWYRADDKKGTNKVLVAEGSFTYQVTKEDQGKYLMVEVIPVAKTGKLTGTGVIAKVKIKAEAVNTAPKAVSVKLKGTIRVGSKLTASYTYKDTEKDKEGKSAYQWYRADNSKGKNKQAIKGANSLIYTLTKEDVGSYIIFAVTPVAKSGNTTGSKATAATAKTVTEPQIAYNCHVKLGLIGNYDYAVEVANLFKANDSVGNVVLTKEGKYTRVYLDFVDKATATAACIDMKKKGYIYNYFFYDK
jgi:hypothetical protein